MKGCGVELTVSDSQMNAWTWQVYDTVKARRGMADDRYAMLYRLKRHVGSPFDGQPMEMSEKIGPRCK